MKKPVALLVGAAVVFGSILFGLQNAHADTVPPTCSRFADVPAGNEYAPYICWLASTGVTTGTSATTFSPTASVTRQQMAAFLYRMAGQTTFTPPAKPSFSDVPTNSDYFKNIDWLKTTGITTGTSATTFSPTAGVTRQQMAAFLYRMAGQPPFTPPSKPSFSDVPANSDYFVSIEWLKTTGITTGTSATTFSPTAVVTRQQMAAFLYRMSTTKLGCTQYPARVGCVLMTGSTPTISGTKTVGSTLTVNIGTWTPTGTTTTIQWYRNGVAISGATRTTYVLVAADGATSITVSVTGTKAGYSPITKTSAAAAIPGAAFTTASAPTISGSMMVGSTLTATEGVWIPTPTLTYQWYRNGSAISGATASTYTLTAADANATMTVKMTATLAGYTTTSKTSAPTPAVQPRPPSGTTNVVPDLAFRACLNGKDYLGQAAAASITAAQLQSLIGLLPCQSDGIASLEGAQYLTGLSSLYFYNNHISDVSPLAGLTNLTFLQLASNPISNVSQLAGLTKLTNLDLGETQISDVSPLAGLTNLTTLDLYSNQISNVSALAGMTKLINLDLSSDQISDVSPLAGLTKLTVLYLDRNQIRDVSPLSNLTNLSELYLFNNQISDISPLSKLINLTYLDLSGNQISNATPLAGLTKLTYLYLSGNPVCNTSPSVCS